MQTNRYDWVHARTRRVMQHLIDLNPTYEYEYFSDERARQFIEQHFEPRVLAAYDMLAHSELRAEVFRLCWLVVKGGFFVDIDATLQRDVDSSLVELVATNRVQFSRQDLLMLFVANSSRLDADTVVPIVLAATPNCSVCRSALTLSVTRVLSRTYHLGPLAITGLQLLAEVVRDALATDEFSAVLLQVRRDVHGNLVTPFGLVSKECPRAGIEERSVDTLFARRTLFR
jgi:hypothetical protein